MTWFKGISQSAQLMSKQEVHLIATSHARMYFIKTAGAPVGIEMNQALADRSFWVVLKGSTHKATAMKLINYITRAERQAKWVNLYPMVVANKKAYDLIDSKILPYLPSSPENISKTVWLDSNWWDKNEAEMVERWNGWMLK
jgi:putative spermidine/putrescine transport system substrate-binding protein